MVTASSSIYLTALEITKLFGNNKKKNKKRINEQKQELTL
jgi:hypothetical protein